MVTWCFKGPEKVIFWFVLLFCRLLQRVLGELVSVMECDLSCSINTLHEMCESRLYEGIGKEI
jgi:hypothetical protein